MKKILVMNSLFLAFSLILSACANAAPTQDPGQVATQVAVQVEAQVATRMAQALADLEATQKAKPTSTPFIPTVGVSPTLASVKTPTVLSLPGVPTGVACLATPRSEGESHPDGTTLYINTAFTKTWTISNQGTCTWNVNYKLKFVSGDQMGGPAFILFGASVPPWQTITLALPLKTTSSVGTSTGYWGVYDDKDVYFGRVWVTINRTTVAPTSASFAVTGVIITRGVGTCTFNASITANGAGTVTYYWRYYSGTGIPLDPFVAHDLYSDDLNFGAAGSQPAVISPSFPGGTTTAYLFIKPNNQDKNI